ncbi:hypothetical protein H5410_038911 [Solanum commersonii]|uniref:Uncharacterized protein n=1 Tax=Solanum commersonii TaxID=4109 RepID=A0A9J5YCR9_SOLCO|nr:hypothetical protein H5410_038911 [Solanum commersonii]
MSKKNSSIRQRSIKFSIELILKTHYDDDENHVLSSNAALLVTQNKGTLTSFTLRSTSKSGSLISVPVDEQVIPITNAESQEDVSKKLIHFLVLKLTTNTYSHSFPNTDKHFELKQGYPSQVTKRDTMFYYIPIVDRKSIIQSS